MDAGTLTDKSGNNIELTELGTITTDSFVNGAGDTVSFMTTGGAGDALTDPSTDGTLRLTDDKITKLKDYTIETWMRFKLPANNIYPRMFVHTNGSTNLFTYEMPSVPTGDKAYVLGKQTLLNAVEQNTVAEQWVHYVFTFDTVYDTDGTTVKSVNPNVYVNGADMTAGYQTKPSITDATALALLGTGTEFTIGGTAANGAFGRAFSGDFATFKIYNTVKTGTEIKALYESSAADYTEGTGDGNGDGTGDGIGDGTGDGTGDGLDVEEGGVLLDVDTATLSDRSGNEITVNKLGTITTGSFTNVIGETIAYMTTGNGTDSLRDSTKAGTLRITDKNIIGLKDYTIETWMRYKVPSDVNVYPKMFLHNYNGGNVFAYEMNANVKKVKLFDYDKLINGIGNGVADKWTHYVFTFDTTYSETDNTTPTGVTVTMYVDGVSKGATTDSTRLTYMDTPKALSIGGHAANDAFTMGFPGDFASFKIYKGVKNADDVADMYSADKNNYVETTVSPSSITFEGGTQVSGAENVSLELPEIYVDLGSDTNMSTVSEETIKLTDVSDGLPVSYSVTVDGTQAVISVQETLNKNKQYMLELTEGVLKNDNTAFGQFCAYFKLFGVRTQTRTGI